MDLVKNNFPKSLAEKNPSLQVVFVSFKRVVDVFLFNSIIILIRVPLHASLY